MTALECFLLFIVTFVSFRLKIITSLYFDHVFSAMQCIGVFEKFIEEIQQFWNLRADMLVKKTTFYK